MASRIEFFITPHLPVAECVADAYFNLLRIRFGSPPSGSEETNDNLSIIIIILNKDGIDEHLEGGWITQVRNGIPVRG
jgi:hypothetical protein